MYGPLTGCTESKSRARLVGLKSNPRTLLEHSCTNELRSPMTVDVMVDDGLKIGLIVSEQGQHFKSYIIPSHQVHFLHHTKSIS